MHRKKILKYISTTTLAILMSTMNLASTSIYANEPLEQSNTHTQLNILNIGAINDLNTYIDPNNLQQNNIMLSNIKNIYEQNNNNAPTIAANLISTIDNTPIYQPYIIQQIEDTTIAVIGIVSTQHTQTPPEGIIIEDEIQTINKYTKELLEQGIENIVVLTDMKIIEDTSAIPDQQTSNEETINSIHQQIDTQVDMIISENELNQANITHNIQTQDQDLAIVQTNEITIADITLNINSQTKTIENEEIKFIIPDDTTQQGNEENEENIEPENEELDEEPAIEAYVIGGTTNNQNPPSNNNNQEDDKDDDDKDDEEEKEDDKDDENSDEDEEDDEEDEDKDDDKDDDVINNNTTIQSRGINPKTGDASIYSYIIVSIAAVLGLKLNRKK